MGASQMGGLEAVSFAKLKWEIIAIFVNIIEF